MTRRDPSPSTLKKLFALSGNLCAYPGCSNPVIDKDGDLQADVCHIEAAEPNGPRYNPKSDDEYRRSFENLFLLCKLHHVKIDKRENVEKYPVELLRQWKIQHETKFVDRKLEVGERVLEQAREQLLQSQSNVNYGEQQVNVQSGRDVYYGLANSYQELKQITNDLVDLALHDRLANLTNEAKVTFEKMKEEFKMMLLKKIDQANLSESEFEKVKQPDVQFAIHDAIQNGARRSEKQTRDLLMDLVVGRLKEGQTQRQELREIIFNEAIQTALKLTADQVKFLTLCFSFTKITHPFETLDELDSYFQSVSKLLDLKISSVDLEHMVYVGAIRWNSEPTKRRFGLAGMVRHTYSNLFVKNEKNLEKFQIKFGKVSELGRVKSLGDLVGSLKRSRVQINLQKELLNDYNSALMSDQEVFQYLNSKTKYGSEVLKAWVQSGLSEVDLNSVGILIGLIRYNDLMGTTFDVEPWLYI